MAPVGGLSASWKSNTWQLPQQPSAGGSAERIQGNPCSSFRGRRGPACGIGSIVDSHLAGSVPTGLLTRRAVRPTFVTGR